MSRETCCRPSNSCYEWEQGRNASEPGGGEINKIRVVVAEDSIFTQKLLVKILESDADIEVVGVARNGREAVDLVKELKPDIVTMDIRMPVMDGFQATQVIMSECPTPILVISSSVSSDDLKISFNAIQAGALDIIEKPRGSLKSDYSAIGSDILRRVKLFAGVKVFRHLSPRLQQKINAPSERPEKAAAHDAIAIGASTGGPSALNRILMQAPADLKSPVFITQHISEGFGEGCVEWLGRNSALAVQVAGKGDQVKGGTVYFAPDRGVMEVLPGRRINIRRTDGSEERLNIDAMMSSVAATYGARSIGVLLTGMGNDGVEGLRKIKEAGGVTLVQDEKTSIVYGMPRAASEAGLADHVAGIDDILPTLLKLLVDRNKVNMP